MQKHRIRLAGPWDSQPVDERRQPVGDSTRCQLPLTLTESSPEPGVLLTRGFHRPTGIDDTTTLRIVLQTTARPNSVSINGMMIAECPVSSNAEYAFDATSRITAFNLLSVLFDGRTDKPPTTLHSVWLEIQD